MSIFKNRTGLRQARKARALLYWGAGCRPLEIPVQDEELAKVVERRSWDNVPKDEKGAGRIHRKAAPGGWREDLAPGQIETIEKETPHILGKFYVGG